MCYILVNTNINNTLNRVKIKAVLQDKRQQAWKIFFV